MDPVEKDRIIEIQQTRIEHLLNRVLRLEEALRMWAEYHKDGADDDVMLGEKAMDETRLLLGDNL